MRRVALQVLQRDVRRFVQAASAGETVLVIESDRVVAELVPPRSIQNGKSRKSRRAASDDEFLQRGVSEGWLSPAVERGAPPSPTRPGDLTLEEVLEDLARDRADR